MVGWHLLLLLVIEVTAYSLVGRYMHVTRGWSIGAAVALAIAIYVGGRALLIAAEFLIARWKGSPIPAELRVPFHHLLAMYLRELGSWILMFTFVMPWLPARRSVLNDELSFRNASASSTPVLFVHGLACNRGNWLWFRRQLIDRGYRAFTMDCTPPVSRIARYGAQIANAVDEIIAATGARRVTLIGHSQGGLSIRAYLDQYGAGKIDQVITLGAPHRGTWLALLAVGPNAADMREGGEWLTGLSAREEKRSATPYDKFACIFTYHDNLVAPQLNAVLPGSKTIALSGIGHLSLALSPTAVAHVLAALDSRALPDVRSARAEKR